MANDKKHETHDDPENSEVTGNVGDTGSFVDTQGQASKSSKKSKKDSHGDDHDNTSTGTKWLDKFLSGIEYVGNKLPEPFTIFLGLFLITGILSTMAKHHLPGAGQ